MGWDPEPKPSPDRPIRRGNDMSAGHWEIGSKTPAGRPAANWPRVQTPTAAVASTPPLTPRQTSRRVTPEWDEAHSPTLLCLIEAVGEVTEDDREVVAAVSHMLSSGRVRFRGHFQDESSTPGCGHA